MLRSSPEGLSATQVKQLAKYALFNLARCFEAFGHLKEAVAAYAQLVHIARKELDELAAMASNPRLPLPPFPSPTPL